MSGRTNRAPRTSAGRANLVTFVVMTVCLLTTAPACDSGDPDGDGTGGPASILNLAHLDHLLEIVERDGVEYGIVHIYAEAPDYEWVDDADEGAACVDDAARAAVVYLRHFETTGTQDSREKAEALLRFVMRMQTDDGRFYNFVWNNQLDVNQTHPNSRADEFGWWAARGTWALGTCARVLHQANPALSDACARRARRTYTHVDRLLDRYGETTVQNGRTYPLWLIGEYASDATSELLLGLVALRAAYPDEDLDRRINRLAEGLAMMQYGDLTTYPYGAHASWLETWHGWGNSQTQALSEAGLLASAVHEAESFYPHLIASGWLHSMPFDDPSGVRTFEQIAYAVRCVAVGLLRLYEGSGDERFATMAGLAASWFTGNNVAGERMYQPSTGRGFDGINGVNEVNRNAGAESTIEAVFTILEIERHDEARAWMHATTASQGDKTWNGDSYAYRVFDASGQQVGVLLNHTRSQMELVEGEALEAFLAGS